MLLLRSCQKKDQGGFPPVKRAQHKNFFNPVSCCYLIPFHHPTQMCISILTPHGPNCSSDISTHWLLTWLAVLKFSWRQISRLDKTKVKWVTELKNGFRFCDSLTIPHVAILSRILPPKWSLLQSRCCNFIPHSISKFFTMSHPASILSLISHPTKPMLNPQ